MFKKVLVPLDGSELAEGILPYISQFARGLDIPLVLLSVIDPEALETPERLSASKAEGRSAEPLPEMTSIGGRGAPEPTPKEHFQSYIHETAGPYASQVLERVEREVNRRLEEVAKRLDKEGVKTQIVVSFGATAHEIVQVAEREGCDLIAMSTHARTALARSILGSITDKIIHSSHLPTLTITPERAKMYWEKGVTISKIMALLDGSALAETVLPYAEELARRLSLEIVLVRVAKMGAISTPYSAALLYADSVNLDSKLETDAANYLKGVAGRLRAKGLQVQWKVLRGDPVYSIVELAHETPQDIIALTTHGRSGLTRWALGSVAEAVIRASGDPVLVIPSDQAE